MSTTKHGRLRAGTERVSYVENKTSSSALRLLAAAKQTNVSSLIREAVALYLKQEDPDKTLLRVAEELAVYKADSKEERAADSLDPEMQKTIAALLRKHRKG
jgi:Arc/MetJ-type ribon-helix-helix transcriptional regulator